MRGLGLHTRLFGRAGSTVMVPGGETAGKGSGQELTLPAGYVTVLLECSARMNCYLSNLKNVLGGIQKEL